MRVLEYFGGLAELDQSTKIHESGEVGYSGSLLHIVRNYNNCIIFFELIYQVFDFASANHRGYALTYAFPSPVDPAGYGVIMRLAISGAGDARSIAIAGSVAAAIRCVGVVIQRPQGMSSGSSPSSAAHGTGESGDDDVTMAGTYNAILGSGWVHDDLGNRYQVDVNRDFIENGPSGPGYYSHNGNDWTKLRPGLGD